MTTLRPDPQDKRRRTTAAHMLETFGPELQLLKVVEEFSEWTKAYVKAAIARALRRVNGLRDADVFSEAELDRMAAEGADSALVLEQLRIIVGEDRWWRANDATLTKADGIIVDEQRLRIARGETEDSTIRSEAYSDGYDSFNCGHCECDRDEVEHDDWNAGFRAALDDHERAEKATWACPPTPEGLP